MSWVNNVWCIWNIDFIAILCHWPPATELLFLVSHSLVITKPWRTKVLPALLGWNRPLFVFKVVRIVMPRDQEQSVYYHPDSTDYLESPSCPCSSAFPFDWVTEWCVTSDGKWNEKQTPEKKRTYAIQFVYFFFLFVFSFSHLIHRIRWMNNLIALSSLINVSGAHGFGCFSFSCFFFSACTTRQWVNRSIDIATKCV